YGEPFDGVDRAEHLGEIAARGAEVELDVVTLAEHAVPADGETVPVDLEAVPESRLHDSFAALDLTDQAHDVGLQLGVDAGDVLCHDGAEQESTEPGRRVDGQHQIAERHPPGRHCGSGVEHLQLGEQHRHRGYLRPVDLSAWTISG